MRACAYVFTFERGRTIPPTTSLSSLPLFFILKLRAIREQPLGSKVSDPNEELLWTPSPQGLLMPFRRLRTPSLALYHDLIIPHFSDLTLEGTQRRSYACAAGCTSRERASWKVTSGASCQHVGIGKVDDSSKAESRKGTEGVAATRFSLGQRAVIG